MSPRDECVLTKGVGDYESALKEAFLKTDEDLRAGGLFIFQCFVPLKL